MFQSTPSRGGRHQSQQRKKPLTYVSIHALTRRATRLGCFRLLILSVSIHALTRRATPRGERSIRHKRFQSTPSRGGRQTISRDKQFELKFQSTPSRGGRLLLCLLHQPWLACFNPRPHAEGDTLGRTSSKTQSWFQSTPSRGGRLAMRSICKSGKLFQSTPSRGGRRLFFFWRSKGFGFNPRPHAEGDVCSRNHVATRFAFQSTPSRGGRHALI